MPLSREKKTIRIIDRDKVINNWMDKKKNIKGKENKCGENGIWKIEKKGVRIAERWKNNWKWREWRTSNKKSYHRVLQTESWTREACPR